MAKRAAAKNVETPEGAEGAEASSEVISEGPPADRRHSVKIRLGGKEYKLRSDASEESLQRVASYVDHQMQKIRERTDTVDSQDIALLTSLNLAREVLQLREQVEAGGGGSGARLRSLIEQIEAELPASGA